MAARRTSPSTQSARLTVARALIGAAQRFPDLQPQALDTDALDERDARLALAIHRHVLQRWLTIEHLLDQRLRQPMQTLEPALRAVLLSAGAQLLFMDRLPAHAVVDESVTLARRLVRPGAAGLVNAVLRRLADQIDRPVRGQPWSPAGDRLPIDGGYVPLREPALPDPAALAEHLAAATSHPHALVERWVNRFGAEATTGICVHGTRTPPIIVAVEPGFTADGTTAVAHDRPGFVVWRDTHAQLGAFLAGHPSRRVQDPAAAEPASATANLRPGVIVDYCAGRGTKTRQLAALHPDARIVATDTDEARRQALTDAFADSKQVSIVAPADVPAAIGQQRADLLLLDVPCTNTAVLARRPEARYRCSERSLQSLVDLQRRIIELTAPLVRPGGHILYSTCSLEPEENAEQVEWLATQRNTAVIQTAQRLPTGEATQYTDGGEYAVLRIG